VIGQPYSDRALANTRGTGPFRNLSEEEKATSFREDQARAVLDAAHDREALGLDASVCARTFLNEIVAWLRDPSSEGVAAKWEKYGGADWHEANEIADAILSEFGDQP
jgi:hypothetical protein